MNNEFIEATEKSKKTLLLRVVVGFLFVCLYQFLWRPLWIEYVNNLPPCEQLKWLEYGFLLALIIPPIICSNFYITAKKILKTNQYPPPGTLVFVRTPVVRGEKVKYRAYVMMVMFVCSLLIPVFGKKLITENKMFQSSCEVTLFNK
jgi:hypothetical protein